MKPAPTLALASLIGSVNPVGAPLRVGSWVKERCVLAMQMGRSLKPCEEVNTTFTFTFGNTIAK